MTDICTLPQDLLYEIFSHLDSLDLCTVSETCKLLHKYASSDRAWKSRVILNTLTKDTFGRFCDNYLPRWKYKTFFLWTKHIHKISKDLKNPLYIHKIIKDPLKKDYLYASRYNKDPGYLDFLYHDRKLWKKFNIVHDTSYDRERPTWMLGYMQPDRQIDMIIDHWNNRTTPKYLIDIVVHVYRDFNFANILYRKFIQSTATFPPKDIVYIAEYATFLWKYANYISIHGIDQIKQMYSPVLCPTECAHFCSTFNIPMDMENLNLTPITKFLCHYELGNYKDACDIFNSGFDLFYSRNHLWKYGAIEYHINNKKKPALEYYKDNPESVYAWTVTASIKCYEGDNSLLLDYISDKEFFERFPIQYCILLILQFIYVNGDKARDMENLKSVKYYLETLTVRAPFKILFKKDLKWCKYYIPDKYPLVKNMIDVFHGKNGPEILWTFPLYKCIDVPPSTPRPISRKDEILKLINDM